MSVADSLTGIATKLSAVLTSINSKLTAKGSSNADTLSDVPAKIEAISQGVDTSDANAAAGDILSGKTAYVNGSKVTGNIPTKTSSDLTASGATVTVPKGYFAAQTQKSVATTVQATPSISVNSNTGQITASYTQSMGYVSGGTKSDVYNLSTDSGGTITPGTSQKTAVAAGKYTTGATYVSGDSNLVSENIKQGVSIFGVAGSLASGGAYEIAIATFIFNDIVDQKIYLQIDESEFKNGCYGKTLKYLYAVRKGATSGVLDMIYDRSGETTSYHVNTNAILGHCYNNGTMSTLLGWASSVTVEYVNSTMLFSFSYGSDITDNGNSDAHVLMIFD